METARRTVLFVEVADGVRISESLGETVALALIKGVLARLEKIAARFSGSDVTAQGDSVVYGFSEADHAFRASCEMQISVNALAQRAYGRLQIRIGLACGTVATPANQASGETMRLCARLVAFAKPSQILISAPDLEALSDGLRAHCRSLSMAEAGDAGISLSEVLWRDDPASTETGAARAHPATIPPMALQLIYRANIFVVNRTRPMLQMGRDERNDIVVLSLFSSRVHARVQARDGHFVLTDLSSNGTFLLVDEQTRELHLRREEAVLAGRGWIGVGKTVATHGEHSVRFALQAETA